MLQAAVLKEHKEFIVTEYILKVHRTSNIKCVCCYWLTTSSLFRYLKCLSLSYNYNCMSCSYLKVQRKKRCLYFILAKWNNTIFFPTIKVVQFHVYLYYYRYWEWMSVLIQL